MKLPEPSGADVKAFQQLYLRRFSTQLGDKEAYQIARQVIGIVYIQTYFPVELEIEVEEVNKPEQLTLF